MKTTGYKLSLIALLIGYNLSLVAVATPLEGHVSNDIPLCKQRPKLDPNGKPLIGLVKHTQLRGLIGIKYEYATGRILYIYPNSGILQFGITKGDFVLKVEKEAYRPCLLPGVTYYPMGYILQLTIKTKEGKVMVIPVKLIDYSTILSGDS